MPRRDEARAIVAACSVVARHVGGKVRECGAHRQPCDAIRGGPVADLLRTFCAPQTPQNIAVQLKCTIPDSLPRAKEFHKTPNSYVATRNLTGCIELPSY